MICVYQDEKDESSNLYFRRAKDNSCWEVFEGFRGFDKKGKKILCRQKSYFINLEAMCQTMKARLAGMLVLDNESIKSLNGVMGAYTMAGEIIANAISGNGEAATADFT